MPKQTKKKSKTLLQSISKVEKMKRAKFLKYYIGVLEENIKEAKKILAQKKKELKKLKK